ncbi:MAG: hypothetical protein KatS3mg100_460 [Candidatus Parcubacteria bacterium]|nr:MAG: hypothetical protein KatS3mg100_460 [Candidatus Parcubacteria bacterium]
MKTLTISGETRYQCEVCGYHYPTAELAERCEAWCREHHSCNLEIIREGVPPHEPK